MDRRQDRINVVEQIKAAAVLYRDNLVGKRFMYVFEGRYIEVIFKAENFRHLTGVDTYLSATRFFNYATRGILSAQQIWFSNTHPYPLCVRKVQHIGDVATMAGSECFVLEEISTNSASYKFGTTDLKFTLCLNRELDQSGVPKSECYVVQSLRDEDCFSKSRDAFVVTHIFSKRNDVRQYSDLLYMDSSFDIASLPPEIIPMLEPKLFEQNTAS